MSGETLLQSSESPSADSVIHCPVCGGGFLRVFWEMTELPVFCNVLCATRAEALSIPRGDIRLAVCSACSYIRNVSFDPSLMKYNAAYENTLRHSPTFRDYADQLVRRLVDTFDLRNKTVLEIACGDGDFLKRLCQAGGNRGIGFDPSYSPTATPNPNGSIEIIADYYSEKYEHIHADLICCRHALEHIPDPVTFLRTIRQSLGERTMAVFFEVPNVLFTLRDLGVWDILYEHCSYFSAASLAECFHRSGFRVNRVEETYGGQFLTLDAKTSRLPQEAQATPQGSSRADRWDPQFVVALAERFREGFTAKLAAWSSRLEAMRLAGHRPVLWGSGTKGVMFLNMLGAAGVAHGIEYAVDINPKKQGKFVAGAGMPIVDPSFLQSSRPGCVIAMNPHYVEEIRAQLAGMNITAPVLAA